MSQILVGNLSVRTQAALRESAQVHGISLEEEIRTLLEAAMAPPGAFVLPPLVIPTDPTGPSLSEIVMADRR